MRPGSDIYHILRTTVKRNNYGLPHHHIAPTTHHLTYRSYCATSTFLIMDIVKIQDESTPNKDPQNSMWLLFSNSQSFQIFHIRVMS